MCVVFVVAGLAVCAVCACVSCASGVFCVVVRRTRAGVLSDAGEKKPPPARRQRGQGVGCVVCVVGSTKALSARVTHDDYYDGHEGGELGECVVCGEVHC